MADILFKNGTEIKDLVEQSYLAFSSKTEIDIDLIRGNEQGMVIKNCSYLTEKPLNDVVLLDYFPIDGEYMIVFAKPSDDPESEVQKLRSDVDFLLMVNKLGEDSNDRDQTFPEL